MIRPREITFFLFILNISNTLRLDMTVHYTSYKNFKGEHHLKCPYFILNYLKL